MVPRLYVLAAAFLWSTAGAAIKLSTLSAWQIAAGRSIVAALTLFLLCAPARRWPSRRLLLVACAYAATVVSFVVANKLTTAANAIFIQDGAPLYVLLLSPWLLGERASKGELWSVPLFVTGMILFFVDRLSPGQLAGNLTALGSGVAFALCIIGLRKVRDEGAVAAAAYGNLIAFAVAAPFAAFGPRVTTADIGIVLFLGVFQLGLAYAAFAKGLAHVPAVESALLILLEPVLNAVWAFFFANEVPGVWACVGAAIILVATAWRTLEATRRPPVGPTASAAAATAGTSAE